MSKRMFWNVIARLHGDAARDTEATLAADLRAFTRRARATAAVHR